jgi:hypothetical protein
MSIKQVNRVTDIIDDVCDDIQWKFGPLNAFAGSFPSNYWMTERTYGLRICFEKKDDDDQLRLARIYYDPLFGD